MTPQMLQSVCVAMSARPCGGWDGSPCGDSAEVGGCPSAADLGLAAVHHGLLLKKCDAPSRLLDSPAALAGLAPSVESQFPPAPEVDPTGCTTSVAVDATSSSSDTQGSRPQGSAFLFSDAVDLPSSLLVSSCCAATAAVALLRIAAGILIGTTNGATLSIALRSCGVSRTWPQ